MTNFHEFLTTQQQRIENYLNKILPTAEQTPKRLHQAMRYSVLNGGKRIRPLLVYAIGNALEVLLDDLDAVAAAVEIIHCYSLIHDDLPAMDDDDLRRGKATCHKAFDEATAILAGDALQALAFKILSDAYENLSFKKCLYMVRRLADACGSQGMAGGQALDLAATGQTLDIDYVTQMHAKKTGALITASVVCGAVAGDIDVDRGNAMQHYGDLIGLAFQIQDDILDIEGDTQILGKTSGADVAANKLTYPALVGLEQAKQEVEDLYQQAIAELKAIDLATPVLIALTGYLVRRQQ